MRIMNGMGKFSHGRRATIRLSLDTDEIALILQISNKQVRRLINQDKIRLTGNGVQDFWNLYLEVERRNIVPPR